MDRLCEVEAWMERRLSRLSKREREAFYVNKRVPTSQGKKRLAKLKKKIAELDVALAVVRAARGQLEDISRLIRACELNGLRSLGEQPDKERFEKSCAESMKRISDTFGRPAG